MSIGCHRCRDEAVRKLKSEGRQKISVLGDYLSIESVMNHFVGSWISAFNTHLNIIITLNLLSLPKFI